MRLSGQKRLVGASASKLPSPLLEGREGLGVLVGEGRGEQQGVYSEAHRWVFRVEG